MIHSSSLCPAYLFSFRFVRLLKLALPTPRDVDVLNWRVTPGDVLGQFAFPSRADATVPAHRCQRLAHGRTRHPHAVGGSGLAAVSDYLPARKAAGVRLA